MLGLLLVGTVASDAANRQAVLAFVLRYFPARLDFVTTQLDAFRTARIQMGVAGTLALVWSSLVKVDEVTRAEARVVPDGKEQLIASLEGGILREMYVREGMLVQEGQELAQLDPTRVEAAQSESQTKRMALKAWP